MGCRHRTSRSRSPRRPPRRAPPTSRTRTPAAPGSSSPRSARGAASLAASRLGRWRWSLPEAPATAVGLALRGRRAALRRVAPAWRTAAGVGAPTAPARRSSRPHRRSLRRRDPRAQRAARPTSPRPRAAREAHRARLRSSGVSDSTCSPARYAIRSSSLALNTAPCRWGMQPRGDPRLYGLLRKRKTYGSHSSRKWPSRAASRLCALNDLDLIVPTGRSSRSAISTCV